LQRAFKDATDYKPEKDHIKPVASGFAESPLTYD
jgi:hypothetical protein